MRFHWEDTHDTLRRFADSHELKADAAGRKFLSADDPDAELMLPWILPQAEPGETATSYLDRIDFDSVGTAALILIQAGATALGYFDEGEVIRHKVFRRYVVRGKGRAQPLHLKTRGKSRYGSRLRLQNAKRQLIETNEKLIEWWEAEGEPDRIFLSCPVRTRPVWFGTEPTPPFDSRSPRLRRVPYDVHVPDHEELLRTWRKMTHGSLT